MSIPNYVYDVINGNNPIIHFEQTYRLHEAMQKLGYKSYKYRVNHGRGYYTQNEKKEGINSVFMEDIKTCSE